MSKVTQITTTISRTHNLGNFNSLRVEHTEVIDYDGDVPLQEVKEITAEAVASEVDRITRKEKARR